MTALAICQLRWRVTCRSALCVFVMNRALNRSDPAAVRIFEPAQLLPPFLNLHHKRHFHIGLREAKVDFPYH